MICGYHLCSVPVEGRPNKKFCSQNCKNKHHVIQTRRRFKRRAIEYLGGQCSRCGYDRCDGAMHFHHPNDGKGFAISRASTLAWDRVEPELDKCVLLCANCHAETHEENYAR